MHNITNLEQLRLRKEQLKVQLSQNEELIHGQITEFTNEIKPILNLVSIAKNGIASVTKNGLSFMFPLLIGKLTNKKSNLANNTLVGLATTLVGEYLIKNIPLATIIDRITGLIRNRNHTKINKK